MTNKKDNNPGEYLPKNNGSEDQNSPNDELEQFFKEIVESNTEQMVPGSEEITAYSFEDIEISDETNEKIKKIKKITTAIEKKPVLSPSIEKIKAQSYKIDYIQALNTSQLAAATLINGPILVIAGAGSGKTRTIVHRVSFLLENGISPDEILLLTFTRKAAKEMLDRVETLLQTKSAQKIAGGTFHAFSAFILRRYANLLNINPHFTIIDAGDAADAIDLIKSQLNLNKGTLQFPKKKRLQDIISSARNRQMTIEAVIASDFSGLEKFTEDIKKIYHGYTKYKQLSYVFDYDDLMEVLEFHLRNNDRFRSMISEKYKYILVDEFQDTNALQKSIVDLIAEKHRNIMVVGDDAQSIYAFRGANFENILRFPETYSDCHVIKIEENYRSNQGILDFANDVINHAKIGYKKALFTQRKHSIMPVVHKFYSQQDEAEFIVDRILELRETGVELNNMAVLYRATWHGNYIQTELMKRNIPYVLVGGIRFSERKHIKDMIAFMRLVINPLDAVSWHRILKMIPGIGKKTSQKIIQNIHQTRGNTDYQAFSGTKFYENLINLNRILNEVRNPGLSIVKVMEKLKAFYAPILESIEIDFQIRLGDIDVFIDLAQKYDDLEKFLTDFALEPPSKSFQDKGTPLVDEGEDKPLTLSTVHSAKGLEWHTIFVPYALDGLFPSVRALKDFEELEEERRLFYVACSRAKEYLYITMPSQIASYNGFFSYPSRFIAEVDKDKYQWE